MQTNIQKKQQKQLHTEALTIVKKTVKYSCWAPLSECNQLLNYLGLSEHYDEETLMVLDAENLFIPEGQTAVISLFYEIKLENLASDNWLLVGSKVELFCGKK